MIFEKNISRSSANLLRVFHEGIQNPVKYLMDLDGEPKMEVFSKIVKGWKPLIILQNALSLMFDWVLNTPPISTARKYGLKLFKKPYHFSDIALWR